VSRTSVKVLRIRCNDSLLNPSTSIDTYLLFIKTWLRTVFIFASSD